MPTCAGPTDEYGRGGFAPTPAPTWGRQMKLLGYLIAACIVLAALRMAVVALALLCLFTMLVVAIRNPLETLGCVAFVVFCAVLNAHPVELIGAVTLLLLIGMILKAQER